MVHSSRLRLISGWLGLLACLYLVSEDRDILQAQIKMGMIQGTVKTTTGESLPYVSVKIQSPLFDEPWFQITNASGGFRFISLPPARYEIILELEGFSTVHYSVEITSGCLTYIELLVERNIEDFPIGDVSPPQGTSSASLWDSYR